MNETKRKYFSGEFKTKVALEAIRGIKTVNEIGQEFGVHPTQVGAWKKELLAQASSLFDAKRGPQPADPSASSERLYSEIGQLKMELDWLKKSRGSASRRAQAMGQRHRTTGADPAMRTDRCDAIHRLCAPVGGTTGRAGNVALIYGPLALLRLIDAEYTRHPFYGSRKIRRYLCGLGHTVNRKRVQRLMGVLGLAGMAPGPNTSRPHPLHKVYPYLLGGVTVVRPNQVWSTDITTIRLARGFVYVVAVIERKKARSGTKYRNKTGAAPIRCMRKVTLYKLDALLS